MPSILGLHGVISPSKSQSRARTVGGATDRHLVSRKGHNGGRAIVEATFEPDGPPVRFHNTLRQYESEPDATSPARSTPVRTKEWRKDMREISGVDPVSMVRHHDSDLGASLC